jgi:PIN domain nuclease of toxin-antitoxin system
MKYLLDTHTVLWFFDRVEKLSETALGAILESANKKYVNIVSAWELAIKISLGKLTFDGGVENFFKNINENGFELLPIKEEHLKQVEILPLLHRDPFDRMLIASAVSENMSLITADTDIHQYNIPCVW